MIDIPAYAAKMWPQWFSGTPAPALQPLFLSGGPAHKPRAIMFLFAVGEARPLVILKVAFTEQEAGFLIQESRALAEIARVLPLKMRRNIPEPLGTERANGTVVAAFRALRGQRILVPDLWGPGWLGRRPMRSFFSRSFKWTRELSLVTQESRESDENELVDLIDRFLSVYPLHGSPQRHMRAFRGAIERSRIRWVPGWQHRDVSVGNVLKDRKELRFLDWEHAGPGSEPWFDIAYAPSATVLLSQRQRSGVPLRGAALSILSPNSWVSALLRHEMNRVWDYSLPLSWAVALVAISTALRRERTGRIGWPDWADLALCMLADRDFRKSVGWLSPHW
jgi:hypothetical protein